MPKYARLSTLSAKKYFAVADAAAVFTVKPASARVLCVRAVKEGIFVRLKNNFYITDQRWERLNQRDFFEISNYLQVPSYVSFLSALSWYGISTQVPRQFFENASLKRTRTFTARDTTFAYYKLKKELFTGFTKKDGFFIATPEKAFLDAVYLYSFGKYKLDIPALDTAKLQTSQLKKLLGLFPKKTQQIARKLCKI